MNIPFFKNRKKILLIEDDRMLSTLLEKKLEELNYKVYSADDGEKAVSIVVDEDIQLILCDINLPKFPGIILANTISIKDGKRIPIIMMSSMEKGEERIAELGVKIDAFIPKPIDFNLLTELLTKLLNNN